MGPPKACWKFIILEEIAGHQPADGDWRRRPGNAPKGETAGDAVSPLFSQSPNCPMAISAISRPTASEAVAAGDGALRT